MVIKINKLLSKKYKTVFIKKKYTNQVDEQKLLELNGNLICSKTRDKAIKNAENKNYEVGILDDGLQDKSIKYDVSIVCFNTTSGLGNSFLLPAGPLRENISALNNQDYWYRLGFAESSSDDSNRDGNNYESSNSIKNTFSVSTTFKITNTSKYVKINSATSIIATGSAKSGWTNILDDIFETKNAAAKAPSIWDNKYLKKSELSFSFLNSMAKDTAGL